MDSEPRHPRSCVARTVACVRAVVIGNLLLLNSAYGTDLRTHTAFAAGSDQTVAATPDALERARQMLARAYQLEQDGKLQEAFDTAREASRTLEALTGLADLAHRQYLQGTIHSLLGKILADNGQYDQAVDAWKEALGFYAPLYNSDAEFWKGASKAGGNFEHAASNIIVTLDFLVQVYEAQKRPVDALDYLVLEDDFLTKLGKEDELIEIRRRSLTIIEATPSLPFARRRRAQALTALGVALTNTGRAGEAMPLLEQASKILSAAPATPDPEIARARVDASLFTGYALQALGRHADALPVLQRASSDLAKADTVGQLRALERVFASLYSLGRFPQALDVLNQRVDIASRTPGMEPFEYRARSHLVLLYYRLGDYTRAKAESAALRGVATKAKIPVADQVKAYANEGVVNRDSGSPGEALDSFNAAIKLLEGYPGTEVDRARHHIDVATALTALRRPDDARAALQRGLRLVESVLEGAVVAEQLRNLLAEDDENRLGQAGAVARQCQRTIAAFSKTPAANALVLGCLIDLGREHLRAGRTDQAITAFRSSADRLSPAGALALSTSNFDAAFENQHQRWVALSGLGLALAASGRNRDAATQLIEASELGRDRYLTGMAAMPVLQRYRFMETDAKYASVGRIAVALSFQSADVDVARTLDASLSRKALFTEISRRQHEALRAAAVRDPALMRRYLDLRHRVARHVVDWQRDGTAGADSEIVERLFREIGDVEARLLRLSQPGAADWKPEGSAAARIAALLGARNVLLEFVRFTPVSPAALRALDLRSLTSDEPDRQRYGVFVVSGATRRVTAVDLGPVRPIDDAVLQYRAIHQRQSALESFKLDESELSKTADRLRRLMFDPLADHLKGAGRIYVAPEGPLSLMPFEAIPVSSAGLNTRYLVEDYEIVYLNTGRDLLRPANRPPAIRSRDVWLVGDPDFDATQVMLASSANGPLPSSRRLKPVPIQDAAIATPQRMGSAGYETLRNWSRLERTGGLLDRIAQMASVSNMNPIILTGTRASEANLAQMHAPRVAVFATHGKFLDRSARVRFTVTSLSINSEGSKIEGLDEEELLAADPLFRSMLAVAGANVAGSNPGDTAPWDGLLTAYEVWGLDLQGADLVALTACETGLGVVQGAGPNGGLRQPSGEVVAGLRQAFVVAGAKSMLMSMWPVSENETIRSLDQFFDSWLRAGEGRYMAFRRSQLEALRHARERRGNGHPFWWAGFVYFGDPGDVMAR